MRIHLDEIKENGLQVEMAAEASGFPVLQEVQAAGEAEFVAPLEVRLRLMRYGSKVTLEGRLETRLRLQCGRCLQVFEQDAASDFDVLYSPLPESAAPRPGKGVVELNTEDVGLMLYTGEIIDTAEAIQEEALAVIPVRPLCSQACKGLCPQCGADLNRDACECRPSEPDPRLATLLRIKQDLPPE